MSTLTATLNEESANLFQRHLIPSDALNVRFAMTKAGQWASSSKPVVAHTVPVAFAVGAVAMSFFNVFSYLLQMPFRLARNIVCIRPVRMITDLGQDLGNVARSAIYVPLGISLIAGGIFLPKLIFSTFAPDYYTGLKDRQIQKIEDQENQIKELKKELKTRQEIIFKLEKEVEGYKKDLEGRGSWKPWSF